MAFIWGELFKLSKSLFIHLQDKKGGLNEVFNPGCTLKSGSILKGMPRSHPKPIKAEFLGPGQ